MTCFQPISDAKDRVMAALIAGLELEFGRGAGEALAHRFLDAEEVEFTWDARVQERWIGSYDGDQYDDDGGYISLDRIAVMGAIGAGYFVATLIVDGDGNAHGMLGKRAFVSERAAREAFGCVH